MQQYILIGDSGHSKVIADCISSTGGKVVAKLDDKYSATFQEDGIVKGPVSEVDNLVNENRKVVIAIGSNQIRQQIVKRLNLPTHYYGIIVHKKAIVSDSASINRGTVVMPGAIINADAIVGKHCIINTGAVVEHDNTVQDFVHISPNATLTGGVKVGEGTQIGAAAVVLPGVSIRNWSIIGAGSTVTKDLPSNITAVGSPAKPIKFNDVK